jgi:transposase InsO family protein
MDVRALCALTTCIKADNGSQYINHQVAKMLTSLRIGQTQSRSRQSNDNAFSF